jgi:hypothetical protein
MGRIFVDLLGGLTLDSSDLRRRKPVCCYLLAYLYSESIISEEQARQA